ncbi:hypothetical protein AB4Z19_30475, partial [Pseudoduganella sp. RAF19]
MISTASEFVRLRQSAILDEYTRAANESASIQVWVEVIEHFPDMLEWVAHNKTVPLPILEILSLNLDPKVRYAVAVKRKLSSELFDRLARDPDETVRAAIAHNAKVPIEV